MIEPNKTDTNCAEAEDLNPFHMARQQFDRAIPHLLWLKHGLIEFLKSPVYTSREPNEVIDQANQYFDFGRVALIEKMYPER